MMTQYVLSTVAAIGIMIAGLTAIEDIHAKAVAPPAVAATEAEPLIEMGEPTVTDTTLTHPHAYQISCTTTAGGVSLRQSTETRSVKSIFVWVNSATPVYIGGDDIDSTHGLAICTDTASCAGSSFTIDGEAPRCLSSSGSVTVVALAAAM